MDNRLSDIQRAKDYLAQVFPIAHTPDRIKEELGLGSSASTVGRKLRAASVGDTPELIRTYYRNPKGKDIAIYSANRGYKPPQTPVKAPRTAKVLYFYTKSTSHIPSPYYEKLDTLKHAIRFRTDCLIWTGSHECPIAIDNSTK